MIRRVLSGLSLSGIITLVLFTGRVVSVPVYLSLWGAQTYGEWLTLTSLATSLSILNLGVRSYANNQLITYYVRGQMEEGARFLHSTLRLYVLLCGLAAAAAVVIASWPGVTSWLQIRETPAIYVRVILLVEGLSVAFALLNGLLINLLRITRQLPRQLAYQLGDQIVVTGAPVAVAALGGQPVHASSLTTLLKVAVGAIGMWDSGRRCPFPIGLSRGSWRLALALLGPSFVFFAVSLSAQLLTTGITLLIAAMAGATVVTVFSTTLMLTNFVRVLIYQGMDVLWPEITAAAAEDRSQGRLAQWHRLALKLVGGFALLATAGVALLGGDVLAAWTRGNIAVDSGLNLLLALYLAVHAPALVSGMFGLALSRQPEMLRVNLFVGVATLVLAWAAVPRLEARGVALALILGQVIGTVWLLRLACRWTADDRSDLVRDVFVRSVPTGCVAIVVSLAIGYSAQTPVGRAFATLSLPVAVGLATWLTWLTKADRDLLVAKFLAAFPNALQWVSSRRLPVDP